MKSETVYKCCKYNSGRYCSRDCQRILESSEQEKLKRYSKDYSVTDNETRPTKLQNKVFKVAGKRPPVNCYLNNSKFKGLCDTGSIVSLLGKK